MEYKYLLRTECGQVIPVQFDIPVSKGDIVVCNPVKHREDYEITKISHWSGGGSSLVGKRIHDTAAPSA